MVSLAHQLHIFFFPFMAQGHIIPMVDIAKLFSSRGIKATIITTPVNANYISKSIERTKNSGLEIDLQVLKIPTKEAGLPERCENLDMITSEELITKFFLATKMLQTPLEKLLQELNPDCLVADMFFPWATESASKFSIPRLVFHGMNFFSLCATECIRLHEPHKKVSSDSDSFIIPNLPGQIKMTRKQLPEHMREDVDNDFTRLLKASKESEVKSFGVIVNSFYELEPDYADFYRQELGRRAWPIGPVSLCNRGIEDKARRGKEASINEHECLKWLDCKKPNSVVYLSFGTVASLTTLQLKEIAVALEASNQEFIWVVRREKKSEEEEEEKWVPEGFEERIKGKGIIIKGWAPQVLILDHVGIGGFVTHCGWNSTLEGISAGKPMVTWPVTAEQFFNEKLVADVLKIGVGVGAKEWGRFHGDEVIQSGDIEKAIRRVMVGQEAEEMRSRAAKLAEMARKAVENGGSSYSDFNALLDQLKCYRSN